MTEYGRTTIRTASLFASASWSSATAVHCVTTSHRTDNDLSTVTKPCPGWLDFFRHLNLAQALFTAVRILPAFLFLIALPTTPNFATWDPSTGCCRGSTVY